MRVVLAGVAIIMLPDTPIIMLPGLCCDGWFLRHQARAFARRRNGQPRHVIIPEWIMHVDPRDGTGALRRLAGRLSTAWHDGGLDGAVVIGHSLGGFIAALACAAGRFVPSAVLFIDASLPVPLDRRPFLREMGERMQGCADPDPIVQQTRLTELLRDYVLQHLAGPRDDRAVIDEVIERMSRADAVRNGVLLQAAAVIDAAPLLARLPGRVAAMAATPARMPVEAFIAARADADIVQVPKAGHFLPLLAAEEVNAAIACMLEGRALRGAGMEPVVASSTSS